jgi:hypothetical protein
MTEEDRKLWQEAMKKIMVIVEDLADLQKRLFKLWDEVDKKLNNKET